MSEASTALFEDLPSRDGPVLPATVDSALKRLGAELPHGVRFGASAWNFPGWRGLVYGEGSGERRLHAEGLAAYARWPLFRAVGLDRNFYRPYRIEELAAFAAQVPDDFRFLIKAPRDVTDPFVRGQNGRGFRSNPNYLDAKRLKSQFLAPTEAGLGDKTGVRVLQFSPFPHAALRRPEERTRETEAIVRFLEEAADANARSGDRLLAAEFRNYEFLTPRMLSAMRDLGIRPVVGLHPSMPTLVRQMTALRFYETGERTPDARGDWDFRGPLIVRWSLAANAFYDTAKSDWAPYDRVAAPDPATRAALASLIVRAAESKVPAFVLVNNKAEGSAPLTIRAMAETVVSMTAKRRAYAERLAAEAVGREKRLTSP